LAYEPLVLSHCIARLATAAISMEVASFARAIRYIFAHQWIFYGIMIAELLVVMGLTAFDAQRIERMVFDSAGMGAEEERKGAIYARSPFISTSLTSS
jgi:FtsH-binding integral membrane protein